MPRPGYRSITIPEQVYRTLKNIEKTYGTTISDVLKVIINEAKNDDNEVKAGEWASWGPFKKRSAKNLPVDGLDDFLSWLLVRRQISEDTARRYVVELQHLGPEIAPRDMMQKYHRWRYVAVRLFVRYRYHLGDMDSEQKARWLDLLKLQPEPGLIRECPVSREDVAALLSMGGALGSVMEGLYYSGLRITDYLHLLNTPGIAFENFGSFRRYSIDWSRGMKRCGCAYLPSSIELRPVALDCSHLGRRCPRNPKILRKWFYRTAKAVALENRADPIVADYYQSRVSRFTVGERHYGEIGEEADRLYPEVMKKLGELKH